MTSDRGELTGPGRDRLHTARDHEVADTRVLRYMHRRPQAMKDMLPGFHAGDPRGVLRAWVPGDAVDFETLRPRGSRSLTTPSFSFEMEPRPALAFGVPLRLLGYPNSRHYGGAAVSRSISISTDRDRASIDLTDEPHRWAGDSSSNPSHMPDLVRSPNSEPRDRGHHTDAELISRQCAEHVPDRRGPEGAHLCVASRRWGNTSCRSMKWCSISSAPA